MLSAACAARYNKITMADSQERITYFAETNQRGKRTRFGIKSKDRNKHMYVIGKSGMGKSTLLENMAIQDIRNGEGLAFFDPHGAAAEKLLDYVPEHRVDDVIYFAPFDMEHPTGFNVMEDVGYDKRHLVVAGLMSAFRKIWVDAWSSRMEYILENTLLALLEYPDSTMLDINRMLVDKTFRNQVVDNVSDPIVKAFWEEEFAKYTDRYTQEATPAIQNKVGQFTANPLIRNIIGQPKSAFDMRQLIDSKKIFIADLSKGRIGEKNAQLLGSMLVTKFYLAALSRADAQDTDLAELPDFYFYVDEFQSFANESFADILSEARKYKLDLIIAHQYIEQMPEEVRAAVFGNVGTMVTFRVGSYDAEVLEREFAPQFSAEDLVNLGFAQIYLKLMINGVSSQPFSAETIPPIELTEPSQRPLVIERSRNRYARPRSEVEDLVSRRNDPYRQTGNTDAQKKEKEKPQKPAGNAQHGKPRRENKPEKRGAPQKPSREAPTIEEEKTAEDKEYISLAELAKKAQAGQKDEKKQKQKNTNEHSGKPQPKKKQDGNEKGNKNEKSRGKETLRKALAGFSTSTPSPKENNEGDKEQDGGNKGENVSHDSSPEKKNDAQPEERKEQSSPHEQKDTRTEEAQHNTQERTNNGEQNNGNEVPEEVLRRVLSVDEEGNTGADTGSTEKQ